MKLKEYEGIIYEMECLIEKANEKIDEVLNVNERLVKENKRLKQKKKKGKKKNKEENENIQNDNSNNNNTKEVNDNKCNEKEVDNEINNNEMKDEMVNVVEHNKKQYQRHPNYDLYNLNNIELIVQHIEPEQYENIQQKTEKFPQQSFIDFIKSLCKYSI